MSADEGVILRFFRDYQAGPSEMLFFNPNNGCKLQPSHFNRAIDSLIDRGLVTKERPKLAYSLTSAGYELSLAVEEKPARR